VSLLAVALAGAAVWAFAALPGDPAPAVPPQPAAVPDPAAADRGPALLFTEQVLKPGEQFSDTLRLVRVTFQDGKPADREEIYVGQLREIGYHDQCHVIENRYVAFKSATVVDTVEKKVLHRFDHGEVLAVEGDRVYFTSWELGSRPDVYRFD